MVVGNAIILTGNMSVYYNLRIVWLVVAVLLLGITIFYGVRIHIGTILSKKTGIHQKREMALMKEGKAIRKQRKNNRNITYTQQMVMEKAETTNQTIKLNETSMLVEENETTILVQNEVQNQFYLIKNIVVVHSQPIEKF